MENLEAIWNAETGTHEEWLMLRKQFIGASDVPVLLGHSKYKSPEQLVSEKREPGIGRDEEISRIPAVRLGVMLEPLIIGHVAKSPEFTGCEVFKPDEMYRDRRHSFLAYNYDGIAKKHWHDHMTGKSGNYMPVECKVATVFSKAYDWDYAIWNDADGTNPHEHVITQPGVALPEMYYDQVQMQMYGLGTPPVGYLAVLSLKLGRIYLFAIASDEQRIQEGIIVAQLSGI